MDVTYSGETNRSLTFSSPALITGQLQGGAGGIAFDSANNLLIVTSNVTSDSDPVSEINPSTGQVASTVNPGTPTPYNVMLNPGDSYAWVTGNPGTLALVPLMPFAGGAQHSVSGDSTAVSSVAWSDLNHAYYLDPLGNGNDEFGTLNPSSFVTTCVKQPSSGSCQTYPTARNLVYDPFTHDLFLFESEQILQINPATMAVVSARGVQGMGGSFFEGAVDGAGHLFLASRSGYLFYEDYAADGLVGASSNFNAQFLLASGLIALAPVAY